MNGNGYQPKKNSDMKLKPPKSGSVIESPMEFIKSHHPNVLPLYKYRWKKWLQVYQFKKLNKLDKPQTPLKNESSVTFFGKFDIHLSKEESDRLYPIFMNWYGLVKNKESIFTKILNIFKYKKER